ncbi:hypothetical protein [Sphaerothrix gracilis]|uniref:hypothetical protein n=1 Tax=Sphaerothrix gracilis TaxID=3151835 RepID=UPI0031FDFC36
MISTASHLLYSAAAVRRIFGLRPSAAVQVREFFKVVWVWIKGQRPTFISKRQFKQHFIDWRKQQGEKLTVVQWREEPHRFSVSNPRKGTVYHVECTPHGLDCECEDYKNQIILLHKGCCKHCYAVLSQLGLGSLSEYLESVQQRLTNSGAIAA